MGISDKLKAHAPLRGQKVVVTGAGGQVGTYLMRSLTAAGAITVGLGHKAGLGVDATLDITDAEAVSRLFDRTQPDAIVHAAAMTDVDGCERDPARADLVNHVGARNVARAAAGSGSWLIAVSTDFVFPGTDPPYAEDDPTSPISVYGASKRDGETAILEASDTFAVARTAWVYGGQGKHFPRSILNLLVARSEIEVVEDERGNPTFAGDLAQALVEVVPLRLAGIVHLTNGGTASRYQLACEVARLAGLDPERIRPTTVAAFLEKYPLPARRPADSSLSNGRAASTGVSLRPWQEGLAGYMPGLVEEMRLPGSPGASTVG